MYSIFADNTAYDGGTKVCIYNDVTPLTTCKVINPKLVMEDSAAGSLEFTLPPGNAGYDIINPMTTDIVVYCEDEEIWRGRVLTEDIDFYKRKKLYCEGELAFLNDTIQPPARYTASGGTTVKTFVDALIANHNANVADNRKFTVGIVSVEDEDTTNDDNQIYRYTNYESTLKCFNDKLVGSSLGGHLRVRNQNGVRYIDYLKDDDTVLNSAADQIIQFGKNLLDYTQNFTMDELATVIVPRGARLETETVPGLEDYLTVKDVNSGSIYVESTEAVNTYGRIIAVVDWENVTNASTLLTKAQNYLSKEQFDKMSLEISMIDLHYLNPSIKALKLLDKVRCISLPHGMDSTFQVTKMEINLASPENSTYTLGTETKKNLTSVTSKANSELAETINNMPSESDLMRKAKENAFAILEGVDGGYVSFETNANDQIIAIKITDNVKEENSLSMWKWNNAGLAHYSRSTYQQEWSAGTITNAMTMDGKIIADAITTGTMSCDRLNGGTINGQTIRAGKIGNGDNIDNTTIDIKASSGVRLTFGSNSTWTNGCYLVSSSTDEDCHDGFGTRRKNSDDGCFLHWATVRQWRASKDRAGWEVEFYDPSDKRLKTNIKDVPVETIRNIFKKISMKSFNFKSDEMTDSDRITRYGFMAQDIQEIFETEDLDIRDTVYDRGDGYLKLEYGRLARFALPAIRDLYEIIEKQQKEIEMLKGEING